MPQEPKWISNVKIVEGSENSQKRGFIMRFAKLTGFILGSFVAMNAVSAAAQEIIVQTRPPHTIVERRGVAPGPGYVWVPGYQRWDGRSYAWVPGQWQRPPRANARWMPHRWVKRGHT